MGRRVLHYLIGTAGMELVLGGPEIPEIHAFSDASFVNCTLTRKSMGGYVIFFGNSPISWSAKKHRGTQALSSTEAELLQMSETTKEIFWLQPLFLELGYPKIELATVLHGDNQPAEFILRNDPTHNARTKHMDLRIKFCGQVVKAEIKIILKYCPSKFNFADIFTKPLVTVKFHELRSALVRELTKIFRNPNSLKLLFKTLREHLSQ